MNQYETVIGLEAHVQLSTKSKIFCADGASFGAAPNSHISAISLAHPGTLPATNAVSVEYAIKLGLALGCQIADYQQFDRKNYFYPDLPKGYQLTQNFYPICIGGNVTFLVNNEKKSIRLHHIHLEEDAGKSNHELSNHQTLMDYNRAGVALLEIVTEPDFRHPDEVAAFMLQLRHLVRWLDISDGNMEEGSLRCDCNVSVRKYGEIEYGERCEIKNLNSMRFAKKAVEFESSRQIKIIELGGEIIRQTMQFDPSAGTTAPMRDKEGESDYRYFPDPDLMPIFLTAQQIETIKKQMPELPNKVVEKLVNEYHLTSQEAVFMAEEKSVSDYFLGLCLQVSNSKIAANILINKILPMTKEYNLSISEIPISEKNIVKLVEIIEQKTVSSSIVFQKLFPAMWENPTEEPAELAIKLGLIQSDDQDFLRELCKQVIAQNPEKVAAYKKGKTGLIGFFMGEVMKISNGKAAPQPTTILLSELLQD